MVSKKSPVILQEDDMPAKRTVKATRVPLATEPTKRILNCLPSRNTENDWLFENAVQAAALLAPAAIPDSKDLREKWWMVGDQGTTGSCVGWATADSVLRWTFVKAQLIAEDDCLSPRFIWMASKETDEFRTPPTTFIEEEGTSLKSALDIARKYGAVPDSCMPFATNQLFQGDAKTFYAMAARLKIASYFNLRPLLSTWASTLFRWRTWLATQGPILTRLGVDETWDRATDTNGDLDIYKPETVRGGHAIALVGYTPTRFIVRNSWGLGWGDKGYAYASLDYAKEAFTEAYGVTR